MRIEIQGAEATTTETLSGLTVLGREACCNIQLPDDSVSRQHCVIEKSDGLWELTDLDSANGTWLNGEQISTAILSIEDVIQVGDVQIRVLQIGEDVAANAPKKNMLATGEHPLLGKKLGGYTPTNVLGSGSFGVVYGATQISLGRHVALKVLSQKLAEEDEAVEKFLQEARYAGSLKHPNIVQVYDCGRDGDNVYYSMEYCPGGSLEDHLQKHGPMPWQDALQATMDCLQALDFAEEQGLVHRDVKPANLMFDSHGSVQLADLGLATTQAESTRIYGGTPHFMAPECFVSGGLPDIRSDLYALGCSFFKLVTGEPLFDRDGVSAVLDAHRDDTPPQLSDFDLDIPPIVNQFMQKALHKNPDLRYSSAQEMLRAAFRVEGLKPLPIEVHTRGNAHGASDSDVRSKRYAAQKAAKKKRSIVTVAILAVLGMGSLFVSHMMSKAEEARQVEVARITAERVAQEAESQRAKDEAYVKHNEQAFREDFAFPDALRPIEPRLSQRLDSEETSQIIAASFENRLKGANDNSFARPLSTAEFLTLNAEFASGTSSSMRYIRGKYGKRAQSEYGRGGKRRGSKTEKAVKSALQWLSDHQEADGFWDADQFVSRDKYPNQPHSDGAGGKLYDVGLTGLSLLAFLGAGNTLAVGNHRENVGRGIAWLKNQQQDNQGADEGLIGRDLGESTLYNHAMATQALGEACYFSNHSPTLNSALTRAVSVIRNSQNPKGGWRYGLSPSDANDSSITAWMTSALLTAQDCGVKVQPEAFLGANVVFDSLTDSSTGRTGYTFDANGGGVGSFPSRRTDLMDRFPSNRSESLTAAALLCRMLMTDTKKIRRWEDHPQYEILKKQANLLFNCLPVWDEIGGRIDFYYWYYGTYAAKQWGGDQWKQWKKAIEKALIENQRHENEMDNFYGSWNPQNAAWGDDGGRVYSTAMCALILEVNYRYSSVFAFR